MKNNNCNPDLTPLYPILYEGSVNRALSEDLGRAGDTTTDAIVSIEDTATAVMISRSPGRIAGIEVAGYAFHCLDSRLTFDIRIRDGMDAEPGDTLAVIRGAARPILSAERTALNFLAHLSGIATATRDIVCTGRSTSCTRGLHTKDNARIEGARKICRSAQAGVRTTGLGLMTQY